MAFWSKPTKGNEPAAAEPVRPTNGASQMAQASAATPTSPAAPSAMPAAAPAKATAPPEFKINGQLTPALGKVVAVLLTSQRHRALTLGDIFARVMPCIAANQFMIADAKFGEKDKEISAPVALVLWATVSDEVDQRLSGDPTKPMALAPKEWRSGSHPWIMETVGPPAVVEAMLKQLVQGPLKGQHMKFRKKNKDGQFTVQTWPATAPA